MSTETNQQQQVQLMSAAEAAKIFAVSEPKSSNKSTYVRFKTLFIKQSKAKGEVTPTTNDVKDEWNKIKHIPAILTESEVDKGKENPHHSLLLLKQQAEQEHTAEAKAADLAKVEWCTKFNAAATFYLHNLIVSQATVEELEAACHKASRATIGWPKSVPMSFFPALQAAQLRMKTLREAQQQAALCLKLRNATDEELLAHAGEYLDMKEQISKLGHLQAKQQETATKNEAVAANLENEICKYLKQQMHYDAKLKYGCRTVTYRRGGVTLEMFQKAFSTTGKTTTLSGGDVGYKSLRYGAYLEYTSIAVKLQGTDLVVNAKYTMSK